MEDNADLVARLLTLAGTIMEDSCADAIMSDGKQSIEQRMAVIDTAGADIQRLVRAVEVVRRRAGQGD